MEDRGISVEEIQRQLRLFERPPAYLQLERACAPGDGIRQLTQAERATCMAAYDAACEAGRFLKFVPASGAASRMFKSLLAVLNRPDPLTREELRARASRGDADARDAARFIEGIRNLALFDVLQSAMEASRLDLPALLRAGEVRAVLEHLLMPQGLGWSDLPKGLLPFHRYRKGHRTAFEEHLVGAAGYVADGDGRCRLHFTVSPAHREDFDAVLASVRTTHEQKYGVRFEVEFSVQSRSTGTLAVDLENRPFRTSSGELLFRPGGHGALLENVNDLHGDLIYIKNIDNVIIEHLSADTILWKKLLGGFLCMMQQRIFTHLRRLRAADAGSRALEEALRFARDELCMPLPDAVVVAGPRTIRESLVRLLDRPVRVCGMVPNTGEPGGGPFWVRDKDGRLSLQIVERAQSDPHSSEQQRIFESATHFSPVDLVCGVRDSEGQCFDLKRYVDPDAVFISEKSSEGRPLKALERPGLWNGGMADWITLFAEVPISTFNPVKTIVDLLRPEHQPE
ncbi:MAG: DUF4301 family protein [Candidatus Krumholzibacteriia bacterium]